MVLSIYRRFSESTNFCSKERLLRPVAMSMMLEYVKNRQPVLFHSHPGQTSCIVKPLHLRGEAHDRLALEWIAGRSIAKLVSSAMMMMMI